MTYINLALIVVLLYIAAYDAYQKIIKNEAIGALILITLVSYFFSKYQNGITNNLLYSCGVSLLIVALYAYGLFGGGDAKFLMVSFFWFPQEQWYDYFSKLMLITLVYSLIFYAIFFFSNKHAKERSIPYGPCISLAWIASL